MTDDSTPSSLHGVIPALPGAEHGLLPEDDEDGPGEGEAEGPPAPVRADVEGEGEEQHHEGQRELVLAVHVAGVEVLGAIQWDKSLSLNFGLNNRLSVFGLVFPSLR